MSRSAALALAALTGALALYTAAAGLLPDVGYDADVALLAVVVIPATLLVVWLMLPLRERRGLLGVALALVVLAVVLRAAELDVLFNLAKLFALVLIGFWFLSIFEAVSWAVLVAVIIPWVDAISVWRGPTEYVVEQQPGVFEGLAIAFRVPGEENAAYLGPPDILFFALFLGAADRFGLRVRATWLAMTALLAGTLVVTAYTDVAGLPALPAICVGFLLPNADLLVRDLREARRRSRGDVEAED
ncbi:MAG TPA: hypothetical protein VEY87_00540 [Gaiellaceae bacterium]|nr:hypothetical protein [Gaiellaceae bacterium]